MTQRVCLTRRQFALAAMSCVALPAQAGVREIGWEELIPAGVPYSEIIGEGEIDEVQDIWKPQFDANGVKFNTDLNGQTIKLPGYIVPLDQSSKGTSTFILVPYAGACIHTPPPPPNQLVLVTTDTPWKIDHPWDAVWVSGRISTNLQSTEIAETGYALSASNVELYEW